MSSSSALAGVVGSSAGGNDYEVQLTDFGNFSNYSTWVDPDEGTYRLLSYNGGSVGAATGSDSSATLDNATFGFSSSYSNPSGTISRTGVSAWSLNNSTYVEDEGWGGIAQSEMQFFLTQRGPDDSMTSSMTMDFTTTQAGYATNLAFTIGGISRLESGSFYNYDNLSFKAYDAAGSEISSIGFFTDFSATPTFTKTAVGNSTQFYGTAYGNPWDHSDPATSTDFDGGATQIGKVVIFFDPVINGTSSFTSAGFGVGDISFTVAVPEPSQSIFLAATGLLLCARRKRLQ